MPFSHEIVDFEVLLLLHFPSNTVGVIVQVFYVFSQNKKNYEQKCRDFDVAAESYSTMTQTVTTTKKELEKVDNLNEFCPETI